MSTFNRRSLYVGIMLFCLGFAALTGLALTAVRWDFVPTGFATVAGVTAFAVAMGSSLLPRRYAPSVRSNIMTAALTGCIVVGTAYTSMETILHIVLATSLLLMVAGFATFIAFAPIRVE